MTIVRTIQSKQRHLDSLFLIDQEKGLAARIVGSGRIGFMATAILITPGLRHGIYVMVITCWDESFHQKVKKDSYHAWVDRPQLNLHGQRTVDLAIRSPT